MEVFSDLFVQSAGITPALGLRKGPLFQEVCWDTDLGFLRGSWRRDKPLLVCLDFGWDIWSFIHKSSSGFQIGFWWSPCRSLLNWFPLLIDEIDRDSLSCRFINPRLLLLLSQRNCSWQATFIDQSFLGGCPLKHIAMASSIGGGDQGIINVMITRPKPNDAAKANQLEKDLAIVEVGVVATAQDPGGSQAVPSEARNLQGTSQPITNGPDSYLQGPGAFTEGEIQEEEDDAVEVNIEEDEMQQAGQWTILARFYSMRMPNLSALFEDMSRAWRLRADMNYKSLRDNLFIITFKAEGDYKIVLQGGSWLHKGDALLVAEFNGLTCPSDVPLEVVPIWIRMYNLPLVLMTKARGELYGSKFGKVREVDVEGDGRNRHDFFRIRVELPVKKPLKTKIAIKIKAQGIEAVRKFDVRYERVPFFCFICGYIGHSVKDCEKKIPNSEVPFQFSADLRCSPLKAFERKICTVKATAQSNVSRKLIFRSAGSSNSAPSRKSHDNFVAADLPPRTEAHDDFESREEKGDNTVDALLASQIDKLQVSADLPHQIHDPKVGLTGDGTTNVLSKEIVLGQRSDMIPAMADLHRPAFFGDTYTDDNSSAQKRRTSDQGCPKKTGRVQQALLEYSKDLEIRQGDQTGSGIKGRAPKRFKKVDASGSDMVDMEATSPGAAGTLAGPMTGSRQEQ